jgi:uncharacterized protein with beta-barrel porin domain
MGERRREGIIVAGNNRWGVACRQSDLSRSRFWIRIALALARHSRFTRKAVDMWRIGVADRLRLPASRASSTSGEVLTVAHIPTARNGIDIGADIEIAGATP